MKDEEGVLKRIKPYRPTERNGRNAIAMLLAIMLLTPTICSAQILQKINDTEYVEAVALTTRAKLEERIAQARQEIENANAYCQRQLTDCETAFIVPQEEAIREIQDKLEDLDLIDQYGTTNVGGGGPNYGEGVNWSVDGRFKN